MILFDTIYDKGFQAGINAERLSNKEAQNHRLEDMLHRGKEIGFNEGLDEGYKKGYAVGYSEGELDERARNGIIELDDLPEIKGEWIAHEKNDIQKFCSLCGNEAPITDVMDDGTIFRELTEYCPHCGAKMICICGEVENCGECPKYKTDCDGCDESQTETKALEA